jgi:methionyl-tRNA formyltransferase
MWIDEGIDSGNIVTTDVLDFSGNESLNEIHIKVMEHAHRIYIKALHTIKENYGNCPSIKQSEIAKGELFLNKMWNISAKTKFTYNIISRKFKKNINSKEYIEKRKKLILIKLPAQ